MTFEVIFSKAAEEDLEKLSKDDAKRIIKKIDKDLKNNPELFSKPVEELDCKAREFRTGDIRTIFNLDKVEEKIMIKLSGNREIIYKEVRRIKEEILDQAGYS